MIVGTRKEESAHELRINEWSERAKEPICIEGLVMEVGRTRGGERTRGLSCTVSRHQLRSDWRARIARIVRFQGSHAHSLSTVVCARFSTHLGILQPSSAERPDKFGQIICPYRTKTPIIQYRVGRHKGPGNCALESPRKEPSLFTFRGLVSPHWL